MESFWKIKGNYMVKITTLFCTKNGSPDSVSVGSKIPSQVYAIVKKTIIHLTTQFLALKICEFCELV